ncbi:MAG: hypothetical protein RL017_189, partial [Pseudomonadota bacterium]
TKKLFIMLLVLLGCVFASYADDDSAPDPDDEIPATNAGYVYSTYDGIIRTSFGGCLHSRFYENENPSKDCDNDTDNSKN